MQLKPDVRRLLNAGADKVSFNSAAVVNPKIIRDASDKYGARKNMHPDAVAWATQMAQMGAGEIHAHQHGP